MKKGKVYTKYKLIDEDNFVIVKFECTTKGYTQAWKRRKDGKTVDISKSETAARAWLYGTEVTEEQYMKTLSD